MYKLKYLKKNIHILLLSTLLSGCGVGTSQTSTSGGTTISSEITTPKTLHKGQVKDGQTGQAISNVTVSIGSHTATTDVNGHYTLSSLDESESAVVSFKKEGYFLGSKKINLKELFEDGTTSTNYLEYTMHQSDFIWSYESTEGIFSGSITIDTSYLDIEGNPYNGTISAELTVLDPTENEMLSTFPGTYKGINTNGVMVHFTSYGLTSISLKDINGDKLSLANGGTSSLLFKNISSLTKPTTLPLWYYDYNQGIWFEDGYAELQADGSYKGEISHLGTWSLNKVLEDEPGLYRGRIIDKDGSPLSDVRLYALGKNWIGSDISTDEDGVFEIEVIPEESFQIAAYNYRNKYGAKYNGIIPAISSGDIVEN